MARAAYLEIADQLAACYAELPPGTLVDSEHEIADQFGVNRLTAREALRELERRLVVRREVGRGTFTAFRIDYRVELGGVASFHRNVLALGHTVTNLRTEQRWDGEELVVRRVSAVDGFLAAVGEDRFPRPVGERIESLIADGSSIYLALESLGYAPRRRSVRVSMKLPPADVASDLGFGGAAPPVWHLSSETVDSSAGGGTGVVLDHSDGWMRTDMFDVSVHLAEPR